MKVKGNIYSFNNKITNWINTNLMQLSESITLHIVKLLPKYYILTFKSRTLVHKLHVIFNTKCIYVYHRYEYIA